jgi:hypothetical protein
MVVELPSNAKRLDSGVFTAAFAGRIPRSRGFARAFHQVTLIW